MAKAYLRTSESPAGPGLDFGSFSIEIHFISSTSAPGHHEITLLQCFAHLLLFQHRRLPWARWAVSSCEISRRPALYHARTSIFIQTLLILLDDLPLRTLQLDRLGSYRCLETNAKEGRMNIKFGQEQESSTSLHRRTFAAFCRKNSRSPDAKFCKARHFWPRSYN
ncbi:hypothetical protein HDK64DRAFT_55434 [Phyllosticta capitalensis]